MLCKYIYFAIHYKYKNIKVGVAIVASCLGFQSGVSCDCGEQIQRGSVGSDPLTCRGFIQYGLLHFRLGQVLGSFSDFGYQTYPHRKQVSFSIVIETNLHRFLFSLLFHIVCRARSQPDDYVPCTFSSHSYVLDA